MIYIDLDEIFEYCKVSGTGSKSKNSEEFRQKEISDSYELNEEDNLVLSQKVVHEVITPQDAPVYDDAKLDLVNRIVNKYLGDNISADDSTTTMQMATVIGTLRRYNFLKEIKED